MVGPEVLGDDEDLQLAAARASTWTSTRDASRPAFSTVATGYSSIVGTRGRRASGSTPRRGRGASFLRCLVRGDLLSRLRRAACSTPPCGGPRSRRPSCSCACGASLWPWSPSCECSCALSSSARSMILVQAYRRVGLALRHPASLWRPGPPRRSSAAARAYFFEHVRGRAAENSIVCSTDELGRGAVQWQETNKTQHLKCETSDTEWRAAALAR